MRYGYGYGCRGCCERLQVVTGCECRGLRVSRVSRASRVLRARPGMRVLADQECEYWTKRLDRECRHRPNRWEIRWRDNGFDGCRGCCERLRAVTGCECRGCHERREYYGPDWECGYWPIGNASTGRSGLIGNAGTGRIDGKYDGGITGLMAGDAIAIGEATAARSLTNSRLVINL
jgi:hypothetical protein